MSRWKLLHSDARLRVRELTPLPRRMPRTFDLEAAWFHHLLSALDRIESIPHSVLLALGAASDLLCLPRLGVLNTAALALAQLGDWLILARLEGMRISFGPTRIQWLSLAALRVAGGMLASGLGKVLTGGSAGSRQVAGNGSPGAGPARAQRLTRLALLNALPIATQLLGTLLVVRGFVTEPRRIHLTRIALAVRDAPSKPIRILHIADVHVERHGRREDQMLSMVRELKPDVILFTGDFINLSYVRDEVALEHTRALWRSLSQFAPVFAVTGSPPVDSPELVERILGDLPVRWLRDETCCLELRGSRLNIVGITCAHDPIGDGQRLRDVIAQSDARADQSATAQHGAPGEAFTVLLHHSPDLAPQAAVLDRVDLHLAGHTHGGQVRLPWFGAVVTGSLYGKELESGLYQLRDMLLFVSRGVGFEGLGAPRARLFSMPEMTLFTLRRGE